MKVGDVGTELFFTIRDQDRQIVDLTNATAAQLIMSLNGTKATKTAEIQSPRASGVVKYVIVANDLHSAGELLMEIKVTFTTKNFTSDRIIESVEKAL